MNGQKAIAMTKYATIDDIIKTLYECISGPPGGQDWERDREIYHPRALITRTRIIDGQFRGVNMVHLWNDGLDCSGRWWIMSIIWDNEREGLTLPAEWLGR